MGAPGVVDDGLRTAHSFCRICANFCGVTLTVDDEDRIVSVRGDRDHLATRGFACTKGVDSGAMLQRVDRILHPLKRNPDGSFTRISLDGALDEIAVAVQRSVDRYGPHSIAGFLGTTGYFNVPASEMLISFLGALGSRNFFSSYTIDCSSKSVTAGRLGAWGAGKHPFSSSDVWLVFGNNPMVSLSSQAGLALGSPAKELAEATARGVKLIVVDPRETETARRAAVFLQPRPGEDAAVVAGIMRILFTEQLIDGDFCDRYVSGLARLQDAVDPFTPEYVERRAGVDAGLLREAALVFGGAGKRGCAGSATGISMSPHSNLVDHMVEALNVLCGRYVRAGETLANAGPMTPRVQRRAEVLPPLRPWDMGPRTRVDDFGLIPGINPRGEVPCGVLSEEILRPGDGQIRCLFVEGGNPAVAIPDQLRVVEALKSLDLLVAVEPFMTATARLADYILPPKLMYERPDVPMIFGSEWRMPNSFAQYTGPVVDPPQDAEVIDDWYLYWALARRLGLTLDIGGTPLDADEPPTTDQLIDLLLADAQVSCDELRQHPHGKVFDELEPIVVQPARPEASGRFDILPDDVLAELERYRTSGDAQGFTHRLTVRRMRRAMNGGEPATATPGYNPAFLNPADLEELGLQVGDHVEIVSDYSRIIGIVAADEHLRSGVVSMSHCFGGLPHEAENPQLGSCTGRLIDARTHHQAINAMPTMSGLPVGISRVDVETGRA